MSTDYKLQHQFRVSSAGYVVQKANIATSREHKYIKLCPRLDDELQLNSCLDNDSC